VSFCFRPQVRGMISTLLGVLERTNLFLRTQPDDWKVSGFRNATPLYPHKLALTSPTSGGRLGRYSSLSDAGRGVLDGIRHQLLVPLSSCPLDNAEREAGCESVTWRIAMTKLALSHCGMLRDVTNRVRGFSSGNMSVLFRTTHDNRIYATFVSKRRNCEITSLIAYTTTVYWED
jgi:hypothetical protein